MEVLSAARALDVARLRSVLQSDPVSVSERDAETQQTALHIIAGTDFESNASEDAALACMHLCLEYGAVWNDLDVLDETPGCIAFRLQRPRLYKVMLDAGVAAELIFASIASVNDDSDIQSVASEPQEAKATDTVLSQTAEIVHYEDHAEPTKEEAAYLQKELDIDEHRILDEDLNGVMMSWETDIMQKTADRLVWDTDLRVLNIGYGMGIIDRAFQSRSPSAHHIVEAHPDIMHQIDADGWSNDSSVTIHKGRWQVVLPLLLDQGLEFDVVFFDTFDEDYEDFRLLFEDFLVGLLADGGRFSFFNGLGADRQISYDVYQAIIAIHLKEAGFSFEKVRIEVPDLLGSDTWHGVRRPYWRLESYELPICKFAQT